MRGPRYNARPMRWPSPLDWLQAWGVPYRKVKGFWHACEAVISLEVLELGCGCTCPEIVSFVVDTGTDVTIVPGAACKSSFRGEPLDRRSVTGLTGGCLLGRVYRAALSIPWRGGGLAPFSFGEMKIAVVASWPHRHGMLGLDALRRVVMLSNHEHLCFMPPGWLCPPPASAP